MSSFSFTNVQFNELGSVKCPRNDLLDVTTLLAKEKPSLCAKIVYTSIDCLKELDWIPKGREETFDNIHLQAKLIKLSKSPGALLDSLNTLRHRTYDFVIDPSKETLTKVFRSANKCIFPVWEIADFATKVIFYISKESVHTLKGINGGALIIEFGWGLSESLNSLAQSPLAKTQGAERDREFTAVTKTLLKLIQEITLVTVGIFLVLSVFFNVAIASVTFTTVLATNVLFTTIAFYHKNLGTEKQLN